jgi:hypothetical protein
MAKLVVNDFGAHAVGNLKSSMVFSRVHLVADSQKERPKFHRRLSSSISLWTQVPASVTFGWLE